METDPAEHGDLGRHPGTGAAMNIAAATVAKFSASVMLKQAVNAKGEVE